MPGGPGRGGTVPELTPGRELTRELAGGASHRYPFSLAAGQLLRAVVAEEDGIDVVVTLFDPEGQEVIHVDGPTQPHEDEDLAAIAESPGRYQLEVRAETKKGGRYRIQVELRQAGDADRARVEAVRLTQAATELIGHPESLQRQIEQRERALVLWHRLGERGHEAAALYQLGTARGKLHEREKAAEDLHRAAALWRELGVGINEADALNEVGRIDEQLDRREEARQHFETARSRLQERGALGLAPSLEMDVENNLGSVLIDLGQPREAVQSLKAALALAQRLGKTDSQANILINLGSAQTDLADRQEALRCYKEGLGLARQAKLDSLEAAALNNLGEFYDSLGEWEKALGYYQQALEIDGFLKERSSMAKTLNNLGLVHQRLGKADLARAAYERSLALAHGMADRALEATGRNNLGFLDLGEQRPAAALAEARQALALAADDGLVEADARNVMGAAYRALGDLKKARTELETALAISQKRRDGNVQAHVTLNLARVARDRGDLAAALKLTGEAIGLVESLRTRVASPDLRATFLAAKKSYYEFAIDTRMALHLARPGEGHEAAALQASERARARSLLEILNSSGARLRHGVPAELVDRERRASQEVSVRERRRAKLLGDADDAGTAGTAAAVAGIAAADRELNAALEEYQQVDAELRASSPRYAALTQPQPLALPEIQALLDSDTLLLEYSLGDERSYLWAVTPTTLASFTLPPRRQIESLARRFYEKLTAHLESHGRTDAEAAEAAQELSRAILGPAARLLGDRRLLVVSDGALQYIPFAALPDPGAPGATSATPAANPARVPYLVLRHEIVSLPSASVLAVIRQELAHRAPPPRTLLVIADPVFAPQDPRVKRRPPAVAAPGNTLALRTGPGTPRGPAGRDCSSGSFARLNFSRREADAIAQLVPAGSRREALDFDASLATATGGDLARYRLVHFATHGCIDSRHPELSGLVLSQVDADGQPREGFLWLKDIYNLDLHADLVVLSACQTALGREIRGEGLIGLTRGFMYAGAARVLASQWSIEDRATAELMKRLYGALLGKEHQRPAAALRQAQLALLRDRRWSSPYYWAGFSLQGEWR